MSEEGLCDFCGKRYPVWVAPNALWNAVVRERRDGFPQLNEPFLCPTCFLVLAEERAVMQPTAWALLPIDDDLNEQLLRARRHWPGERVECLYQERENR